MINYDVIEAVALITLDRPDALNTLNLNMKRSLRAAVERARDDSAVRAVLLTGNGRAFCAGQDLREHSENLARGRGLFGTVRNHYNPIALALATMAKPVIAYVNGVAAGAGAALAFACDLRVGSESAKFSMAFGAIGLAPDSGASWTLPRLVGPARAREMLLLGDEISAEKALELGLLTAIGSLSEARELVVRLAHGPTEAYVATKRALDFGATHTLAETLDEEADLQDRCVATEDHQNAVRAFLNKEKQPRFHGR
ncbi:enoyl-CoA hydratase/isomerase family protein [Streptosporangiaceae bacterium NEAU-GS5]|nr:enoyl-CoA hydratase/isomerase family protein [Streptosporangiaceae bacterium NEAU-GS5]